MAGTMMTAKVINSSKITAMAYFKNSSRAAHHDERDHNTISHDSRLRAPPQALGAK
jgi:hypothetical protein